MWHNCNVILTKYLLLAFVRREVYAVPQFYACFCVSDTVPRKPLDSEKNKTRSCASVRPMSSRVVQQDIQASSAWQTDRKIIICFTTGEQWHTSKAMWNDDNHLLRSFWLWLLNTTHRKTRHSQQHKNLRRSAWTNERWHWNGGNVELCR